MECAIFCLLALCAVQAVSAFGPLGYFEHGPDHPSFRPIDQMIKMATNLQKNIEVTQKMATKTGNPSECVSNCFTLSDYYRFMDTYVNPRLNPCQKCHETALLKKDVKMKKTCCLDLISQIQWQAKRRFEEAKKCIAECKSTPMSKKPKNPNTDRRKQKNKNQYASEY